MAEHATTVDLGVLEDRAQQALDKIYQGAVGAREFAEAMRSIQEGRLFEEAGFPNFRRYYLSRWADEGNRAYATVTSYISQLRDLERFEEAADGLLTSNDRKPTMTTAGVLADHFDDPQDQVGAWQHHLDSGRPVGEARRQLQQSITEYKDKGIIEKAEAKGIPVPAEPKGKTPSEAAWLAMADASRIIRGVDPADAARVESGRIAARYQEQMWALAEWTRLFAHEVSAYAEQTLQHER
jgi:hypothetical protein